VYLYALMIIYALSVLDIAWMGLCEGLKYGKPVMFTYVFAVIGLFFEFIKFTYAFN
jgi:hypothetical protein